MSIRDWPDGERPREKLRMRGSGSLSDAELLAVVIGPGRRGSSAVDMGRELLSGRGGLKGLLHAPPDLQAAQLAGLASAVTVEKLHTTGTASPAEILTRYELSEGAQ